MVDVPTYSNGEINRAGQQIRDLLTRARQGQLAPDWWEQLDPSLKVVDEFRRGHQTPLTKCTMGLRSAVATEGLGEARVSQRLKRLPTILAKLTRETNLALSRMQDIGGCRAIVSTCADLRRLQGRLEGRANRYVRTRDYIVEPRESGYRGVHVIMRYDSRLIEVQLRTQIMHDWAIFVERLGQELSFDLKSGEGPDEVLRYLSLASQAMAVEEGGGQVPDDLLGAYERARTEAVAWRARDGG